MQVPTDNNEMRYCNMHNETVTFSREMYSATYVDTNARYV